MEITLRPAGITLYLDQDCWSCKANTRSSPYSQDSSGSCDICGGSGYQLSIHGETILQFIARHWDTLEQLRFGGR